ncbi:sulfate reduction electron transfer complex DsrMKJOP subunit DsrO [Chlorobium sp. N1]|uniref:sulfate reduction electron transfer complex DsrMKJOP subunit DsrO n=1 Tax=Chlorobium sp. N1 TaxID=2491138 RepID=UPI0013F179EA|nr:4Fe-4S dicluster domain-containing protein [Chlorobium sp. N1]
MNEERRTFMKKAGLGLMAGFGAAAIASSPLFERVAASAWAAAPKRPGTRWGMVIDTRRCREGCSACVDACRLSHNVPTFSDPRRRVEWIHREEGRALLGSACATQKLLPALCNHCEEPSCVRSCPTDSIFRRRDGIVAVDYHRCIGCRSCMLGCPYGEVSFNWSDPRPAITEPTPDYPTRQQGVVEKCNFCSDRLKRGLQPSCSSRCPEGAMTFGDLNDPDSAVRRLLASSDSMRRKPELGTEPKVYYII